MKYNLEVWVVSKGHRQEVKDKGPYENEMTFVKIENKH